MSDSDKSRWVRIREVFDAAMNLPVDARERFLNDECADDAELTNEVNALLAAAASEDELIEDIVSGAAANLTITDTSARLEQRIGNYKLVSLLGTGGMGNVYLARRVDEQFEHEVAIKVLQTGRRDSHFVQRILAERQVLANLDHPNICRLLDGGETDDGVPYLVMEHVRGVPIDEYCDQHKLSVNERLTLFQHVCMAVDYAHRNLVVHRDVKPSNILITADGEAKLLDFGIAKLIDDTGTATGNVTVDATRMLTPEFASPEQVRGEPVAIATDVYSLGVLLYQLLCGRGPYRPRSDMPSDLARAILEEVPSKPSTALTATTDLDAIDDREISSDRHTSVARLKSRLQGDLDNIALMALRKEPDRRYVSARALHDDIENYLSYRPIAARPDRFSYRAAKFVRRHRAGMAITVLVIGVVSFSVYQVVGQRDKAEVAAVQSEQVTGFLANLFASASPSSTAGSVVTAADLLRQGIADIELLDEQPAVQGRLLHIMGDSFGWLGSHEEARPLFQRSVELLREYAPEDREEIAAVIRNMGDNERLLDNFGGALALFQESLEIWRELHGENHPAVAFIHGRIGDTYRNMARLEDARASLEAAVAIKTVLGELDDRGGIDVRGNLTLVVDELGRTGEAIELAEAVVAASKRVDGEKHPNTMIRTGNLGLMQNKVGLFEDSLRNNTIAFNYGKEVWSTDLRNQSWVAYHRGNVLRNLGRLDEAEVAHIESVVLREQQLGARSVQSVGAIRRLGIHYLEVGRYDEARTTLDRALSITMETGENPGREAGRILVQLARLDNLVGDHELSATRAVQALAQADYLTQTTILDARLELAVGASGLGRSDEAAAEFATLLEALNTRSGEDVVAMLPYLNAATRHHRKVDEPEKAMGYAERAYRVSEQIQPQSSWPAALARSEYGMTLQQVGDPEQAQPLLQAAYRDLQAVFGDDDWRVRAVGAAL